MTSCWGITDGSAGMVAQVRSLAIAMGLQPEMKIISLKKPWAFLPNIFYDVFLKPSILSRALRQPSGIIAPYPDIVISCGRKAALITAAMKQAKPFIKAVHIQDPQMSAANFDIVVAMGHDKIEADNVIKTSFALHSINPEILKKAYKKFAPLFDDYPRPHLAVLLGGSTNKYNFTKVRMEAVIKYLQEVLAGTKGSLLITPSRRTGDDNIEALKQSFSGNERVYIYDGKSENPYMGMLACADKILVTNDSVNMMSEATATKKPVTIINLEGHENTKPERFASRIKSQLMTGEEMEKLAAEVKKRLGYQG